MKVVNHRHRMQESRMHYDIAENVLDMSGNAAGILSGYFYGTGGRCSFLCTSTSTIWLSQNLVNDDSFIDEN